MLFLGPLRRRLTKIDNLAYSVSWADAVKLSGLNAPTQGEMKLFVRNLNRHVTIRPGTSDLRCLRKVFVNNEYAIPFETNPRLIVDAGANIGLPTLFFSGKFPGTKIIAIEPEPSNYDLLVRNCSGVTNVTLWNAAVWNTDTSLRIANPD